jgi:phosphoadenosine phosphosulfate reductase
MNHPVTQHSLDAQLTDARSILTHALDTYPERIALACSFGGPSGMVLLDLALQLEPKLPVFCIDTQLLFPETYSLVERVEKHYGITVEMVSPRRTVEQQAADHGAALWARNPDACCALRKVEPLQRYLKNFDAWLTAIRRDQTSARTTLQPVAWDEVNQVVKIAPMATWTEDDVWSYVQEHDIPVNTLHFEGYPSIGCTHCTRRVGADEDVRAGRWAGFDKTECGIHVISPELSNVR